jgi:hypothetical protein
MTNEQITDAIRHLSDEDIVDLLAEKDAEIERLRSDLSFWERNTQAEIERLRDAGNGMAEFLEVFITDKAANPPTLDAMAHYLKAWRKDDQ